MINIINQFRKNISLLKNIQFLFHRKRRDPSVPTQNAKIEPFSINFLYDNPGARYTPKKLGRGPGSGKGYLHLYLVRQVEEAIKVKKHNQEEAPMFVLREVKPQSKKDCPNTERS